MVLHLKEHPYLFLASGSSMCSVNSLLMTSKAVGTGMLVNRAETSKETSLLWVGANYTTTTCSLQETHPLHLGFMVYLKYIKLTVPCAP